MKSRVFCSLILLVSLTMAAQVTKAGSSQSRPAQTVRAAAELKAAENQKEIDAVTAELKATVAQESDASAQFTALDKSDAELKKSDQAQIDTSQMVQTQLNRLKNETLPALQARGNAWDVKRQNHINSGCPAEGGRMPLDQANRCNAETDALMAERGRLLADVESAVNQRTQYEQLRDAVTATTVSNAAKEKANNAQRDAFNAQKAQLEATKKRLEAKLEDLKKGIDSCAKVLTQSGASCETIKSRCGNIQFDGSDPGLAGSPYDGRCGARLAGKPKTGGVTANK
jgi:chromosome segregation ATPase